MTLSEFFLQSFDNYFLLKFSPNKLSPSLTQEKFEHRTRFSLLFCWKFPGAFFGNTAPILTSSRNESNITNEDGDSSHDLSDYADAPAVTPGRQDNKNGRIKW